MSPKATKLSLTCQQCGSSFLLWPSEIKKGRGKYCSKACYWSSGSARRRPLADRFWEKVDRSGTCWEWTHSVRISGYGQISIDDRPQAAHRVAWELTYGAIPDGKHVLHHCDNRRCVRPDHLFLGTNDDNVADMVAKTRQAWGERHHWRTLTEADVISIRTRHAAGATMRDLALEYGCSYGNVSTIIRRESWKHLTEPAPWTQLSLL